MTITADPPELDVQERALDAPRGTAVSGTVDVGVSTGEPPAQPAAKPVSATRQVTATASVVVALVALALGLKLTVISGLQHRSAQQRLHDTFRFELAQGTAPVGQADRSGKLLALGAPVALIDIPSIGIHEVVAEGTTGGVLMDGPGHRRDTPLPGQAGTSVIFGRAAAYGGPFKHLHELADGAKITVTTGQGVSTFTVIGQRESGAPAPAPVGSGKGRLVLVTATGLQFVPGGTLRIDADLESTTRATPAAVIPVGSLPAAEQPLGADTSTVWALVLWMQGLVLLSIGAVWSWQRWGRHQTWIVFAPLGALVALSAADEFMKLLPNLL